MSNVQRHSQEFYCGECAGYFMVRLNLAINHEVLIKCPNCGHEHQRCINNGSIFERGRFLSEVKETVRTTKSSYSKTPRSDAMIKAHDNGKLTYCPKRRDGVTMTREQMDRWIEISERERTGAMFDD